MDEMSAGDAVTNPMRERLAREDEVTIKREEYGRLQAIAVQRAAGWGALEAAAQLGDKLALCFRTHYQREIESGAHAQYTDAADACIHYLLIERDLTRRGMWGRIKYALWGI